MKGEVKKILDEFKENETRIKKPIGDYRSVKGKYNKKALEKVKKESTKAILELRNEGANKALGRLEEIEQGLTKDKKEKELTQQDLTTLIYLLENTDDSEELEELYRENGSNSNFKKIFKVVEKKKDFKGLSDKVDIEQQPSELVELRKARDLINSFKMDNTSYPFFDSENVLDDKSVTGLEYKRIDDLLNR